jgi:SAM-dependent methyltransferase
LTTPAPDARHRAERRRHWDTVAAAPGAGWGGAYHRRLSAVHQFLVAPGQRVLEVGCGAGDLLAACRPSFGVGVDFSTVAVDAARRRHPALTFVAADAHQLPLKGAFDVVILSDLVNDVWNVQEVLEQVGRVSLPHTRVVLSSYNRLWEPVLGVALALGLARPVLHQNWLTLDDLTGLLHLAGFDVVRESREILLPLDVPLLSPFLNRALVRVPPFKQLALSNVLVARPKPRAPAQEPTVSVIVPARNEAGNIPAIFARMPRMGRETEIVFVEGHSRDDTWAAIQREVAAHPEWRCQTFQQTGIGKGDAVRLGFAKARGELLMILDADLTVPPEDLPRFYEAARNGLGEFVNGVRLVYPMEGGAMRFLNFLGNHFFSWAFTWLMGQRIKDTLCGTKVVWRQAYDRIAANRSYFGDFDPFGDFDLLFGAARLSLRILDLPIRYRMRTYGDTNISRWKHGALLLRMTWFALWRLKFR